MRVYIAGPYSADNVITVLDNIRNGMRAATEVMLAGDSPFCPWLDFHFQLMLRDGEALTVEDYYRYSLAWLEASDRVLVLPGWENSKGTIREIARARELGIPVEPFEGGSMKDTTVEGSSGICPECSAEMRKEIDAIGGE